MNKTTWYQVTLPYAVFGIEKCGNKITEAPRIAHWMVGKSFVYVCEWIAKKHGTIKRIEEEA